MQNADAVQELQNLYPFCPGSNPTHHPTPPVYFSSIILLRPNHLLHVIHSAPRLQRTLDSITAILRITKQHLSPGHIKHRVRHICITRTHPALHHNNLLALPRVEDGHACDRGAWLQGDGVYGVVCADDERDVCVGEVVIDFVHFEDDFDVLDGVARRECDRTYYRMERRLLLKARYIDQACVRQQDE